MSIQGNKDFDPKDTDRPSRSKGYQKEAEEIFNKLGERGDQRIGQYIVNVIRSSDRVQMDAEISWQEQVERVLWNLEAPELLELVEEYETKR